MLKKYEKTIVVNLIGGPCSGKSTIASGLFYNLKIAGIDCELALEYAKDRVWEESFATMNDLIYVFGKQYHRIWKLKNKVQVIITDSPLPLSIYYAKLDSQYFEDFVMEQYKLFDNVNYIIERNTKFNLNGRVHTETESKQIDIELKKILDRHNVQYSFVKNTDACDVITKHILDIVK